jgi:methyl-accepting chemotaxis protein
VDLACRISVPGQAAHIAHITDLSLGGASILNGPLLPIGRRGMLEPDHGGVVLPFTVRGIEAGVMHVAFELDAAAETKFSPVLERLTRGVAA